MRARRIIILAGLLLGTAHVAGAAEPTTDACTPDFTALVAEMQSDCDKLAADRAKKATLAQTDADEEKNKAEIDQIDEEIRALEAQRPLLARGLCSVKTRTCDTLATQLSVQLDPTSLQELVAASRASAASVDAQIAREAAAPDRQTSNNKSGSSAQIDPVESIQPITLAGGAIALSGTRSGTKGVGSITINPLALASPGDVVAGRLLDLAVSAPFDLDQGTSQNRQYVSARLRANLTAPISAAALQTKVVTWLKAEGRYADSLQQVLAHATSVRKCAEYIATNQRVSKEACEQDLDSADVLAARAAAYTEIDAARRAADKYYLGLDVRLDAGDPTGPDTLGDKGTHLLGGLAAGTRISQGGRWDWELRGRAAGDYFRSRDDAAGPAPKPVFSFDWGAAFIFSGRLEQKAKQRMAFGVGIEGRHAGGDQADARQTPTNFAYLNLMTVVPALSGGDLGLAISIPLAEEGVPRGTVISLSTDLGLLDHSTD
jgi:hypothetical protein